MSRPLLLVPPSEAKRTGGSVGAGRDLFAEHLGPQRAEVRQALGELLGTHESVLARVLGVRGALLERARIATEELVSSRARVLAAWRRYDGVVWAHLDPASLTPGQRRRILVPSGLYGLNRADDAIADYRLKMSAPLGGGRLASHWREPVSRALADYAGERVVYDLLTQEHRAALEPTLLLRTRLVRVDFVRADSGRAVGHDAKAAKGVFTRHLLDARDVADFSWRNWRAQREDDQVSVVLHA